MNIHSEGGAPSDLLRGAEEIAEFVFGDPRHRRKVYYLVEGRKLPTFRLGATICARRSTVLDWIERQECLALSAGRQEAGDDQ